jgi:L-fuculose-phosphate aldolase
VPFVKDCNTIILANHGTLSFGPNLENAYFNTEIIDAYCKILILARQLGRVNYFSEQQTRELLELKKRLGYDDVRFRDANCSMCGDSSFDHSYTDFVPQAHAFPTDGAPLPGPSANGHASGGDATEDLVRRITDQVMADLAGAGV